MHPRVAVGERLQVEEVEVRGLPGLAGNSLGGVDG